MKQLHDREVRILNLVRRLVGWMGHQTLLETRWGRRVMRQVFREREFGG